MVRRGGLITRSNPAPFLKKEKNNGMARIRFTQDICGVPAGTIKELPENITRELVEKGLIERLPDYEKVERIEPKRATKVETTQPPIEKKPRKPRTTK